MGFEVLESRHCLLFGQTYGGIQIHKDGPRHVLAIASLGKERLKRTLGDISELGVWPSIRLETMLKEVAVPLSTRLSDRNVRGTLTAPMRCCRAVYRPGRDGCGRPAIDMTFSYHHHHIWTPQSTRIEAFDCGSTKRHKVTLNTDGLRHTSPLIVELADRLVSENNVKKRSVQFVNSLPESNAVDVARVSRRVLGGRDVRRTADPTGAGRFVVIGASDYRYLFHVTCINLQRDHLCPCPDWEIAVSITSGILDATFSAI